MPVNTGPCLVFPGWQVCWHPARPAEVAHSWSQHKHYGPWEHSEWTLFKNNTSCWSHAECSSHMLEISPSQTPVKSTIGFWPCSKDSLSRKWGRKTDGACKARVGDARAGHSPKGCEEKPEEQGQLLSGQKCNWAPEGWIAAVVLSFLFLIRV